MITICMADYKIQDVAFTDGDYKYDPKLVITEAFKIDLSGSQLYIYPESRLSRSGFENFLCGVIADSEEKSAVIVTDNDLIVSAMRCLIREGGWLADQFELRVSDRIHLAPKIYRVDGDGRFVTPTDSVLLNMNRSYLRRLL